MSEAPAKPNYRRAVLQAMAFVVFLGLPPYLYLNYGKIEIFRQWFGESPTSRADRLRQFMPAAEAGNAEAQLSVGILLADSGVRPEDRTRASAWLRIAARNLPPERRGEAEERLRTLERDLPPAEIERAIRAADEWKPVARPEPLR